MSQRDEELFIEDSEDFKVQQRPRYARLAAVMLGWMLLAAIVIGIYYFMNANEYKLIKAGKHPNFQGVVSLAEIQAHNQPEDCWIGLHGNAYDLTDYAPIHPGEPSVITRHCGTNATVWYNFEHSVALLPIVDPYLLGTMASDEVEEAFATPIPTSSSPTTAPSQSPSTPTPTRLPTEAPTRAPVVGSLAPTTSPTLVPTLRPTISTPNPTTLSPTASPTIDGCPMEFYTLADLAQHDDETSCWYGLYGVVYDLTWYIDEHKGGRGVILMECGTDATVAFVNEKKHDVDLLLKKGFASSIIGRIGNTRGRQNVPCDEVDLVAVNV